ncbi:hypothetical protein CCP4SC76_4220001 [Gammaproteobacteria bacterium]
MRGVPQRHGQLRHARFYGGSRKSGKIESNLPQEDLSFLRNVTIRLQSYPRTNVSS